MNLPNLNSFLPRRTLLYAAGILFLLSFLSLLYFKQKPSVGFEEKRLEEYIHEQQRDYEVFLNNKDLLRDLVQRRESLETFREMSEKEYGIYLFAETISGGQELIFWNSQRTLPPDPNDAMKDGEYFKKLPNGYYFIIKRTLSLTGMSNKVVSYAMIPILYKYEFQQSSYLRSYFAYDKSAINRISISEKPTPYNVNSINNKTLFYLEKKAFNPVSQVDPVTAFLRLLAFILLLAYVHFLAESITIKRGSVRGISVLVGLLLAIRILLFFFPNLFSFRQFELFDPTIYGTNWFNRSLGDLLINVVFFCWIVVFAWFSIGPLKRLPKILSGRKLLVIGISALFILIFSTFQFANVVRSLVKDSKISFNVTDFFSLDKFTIIGFIVLALLALSYHYFARILFRFIFPAFQNNLLYIFFGLAFIGLAFLSFRTGNTIVLFHLPVLLWLIVYTILLNQEQFIINRFRITVTGILFWIFIFSVSLAAIILVQNQEKEFLLRKSIAEKYDQLTDPSGERTLSIALAYLDNDFLQTNFRRFESQRENSYIRDSIISENITGYLNKYETKIFVFDSLNNPVNNTDPLTYTELNNLATVQSRPTEIPDLYYHERSYDQYNYITKRVISDTAVMVGTFFIVSTPKKYNQDALYPELFRRINQTDAENSPVYSYAVYKNNLLINSSSKYPFQIHLEPSEIPKQEFVRRINGDNDELWYRAGNNKIIVIAKKQDSLIESITLFSYLFCAFLFMVGLIQFISFLLRAGNDWRLFNSFWHLNIRSQVHSTIIFISILSFIIIGIATISFFISRYNRNNIDRLSRTAGIMVREMQKRVEEFGPNNDAIRIYDPETAANLQRLVNDVADIHNVDVNVYDLSGNLQVSSEAEMYKRGGILSPKMHPEAYYHLHRLRQVQYVQEESISSLKYLSIYSALRDERGLVYGYLNIPYFLSGIDINQEISNFLVTIINLNAFIFLIAGIIALFITNKITRSFSIIGDKMRQITLGKTNEEIVWNKNDEIGELVTQYNKMVRQLELSAEALAKSEREGAWREMARQVAHEIKNPLTPMKLSIQYLQKAINNNQPNVKELTSNVATTLVEQIDHLSKIAADFARFANIGNRNIELFDLHQVLEGLKDLHHSNPKVRFNWKKSSAPLMMRADKTHMNRLFTNLLTNAIDACADKECLIEVIETVESKHVIIEVKDNGEGIPEETQPKIFTPNFTTKSSGTGLGLAMCKSIVEQAGGTIWFDTTPGVGASFFIQLPLADKLF